MRRFQATVEVRSLRHRVYEVQSGLVRAAFYDREGVVLAIHVAQLGADFLASRVAPRVLISLVDLGAVPNKALALAMRVLDRENTSIHRRMAARF